MSTAPRVRVGRPVPRRHPPSANVAVGAAPRLFVLSTGALAAAFLTALLYLHVATSVAVSGYDLQTREARRAELARERELLEVQLRRLAAPARIEAEAERLGLHKTARVFVLDTGSTVAGTR